jgi:hypothetical protein
MSVKNNKQEEEVSMNDITVVITGMILLMSPAAYVDPNLNPSTTINSAVAVNATNPQSKYGMDIPQHFAKLVFQTAELDVAYDPEKRLYADEAESVVDLEGDHVQIGTFDTINNRCKPNPSYSATIMNSIKDLPRMGDLVDKADLADNTYPVNGKFDGIDSDMVSGWLEVTSGRLGAIHSEDPKLDAVMFQPTHRSAMLAPKVEWHIKDQANCVLVKPFSGPGEIDIPFKKDIEVSVNYQNEADMHSGEVMPGVGFDYEVLYGLYKYPPAMPPIPFALDLVGHTPKQGAQSVDPPGASTTSVTTGINCGPATIPSGG